LLVSIVILALLVGLLVPAVFRAYQTARVSAAAADIRSIEQALADFKASFGSYPPSRLVVAEDGDYSAANLKSIPNNEGVLLAQRSLLYLRRFWPRIALRTDGIKPAGIPDGGWYDMNGDHLKNPPYIMYGHECLAFFLGGIPEHAKGSVGVAGFGSNPLNPFTSPQQPPAGTIWPFRGSRTVARYSTRVVETEGGKVAFGDQFGEGKAYAYFSSYTGQGYDPDDVNVPESDDDSGTPNILGVFQTNNAATPHLNTTRVDIVASPAPNPYTDDSPMPVDGSGNLLDTELRRRIYYANNTYQIICAGVDGQFGIGGQYTAKATITLPFYAGATNAITGQGLTSSVRVRERDNVTNFTMNKLD
jgi:general secretion pathway protein G